MLETKVIYHFSSSGMKYFTHWFEELKSVISKQEGFLEIDYSIENSKDDLEKELVIVIAVVRFENLEELTKWLGSDRHKALSDKIRPYFLKAPEIERKEIEEGTSALDSGSRQ